MIEYLHIKNVGPAPEMQVNWASRFNVITGDNGLGKSFLLDLAWWSLTRTWANTVAQPSGRANASITYSVKGKSGKASVITSQYKREAAAGPFPTPSQQEDGSWPLKASRPSIPGIVIYARVDGGFSVWDPARNYWRSDKDRPAAYHFAAKEVWDGLDINGQRVCEGLERDWVNWQEASKPQFKALEAVLRMLSPVGEPILAGPPKRVFLGEGRNRPTLQIGGQVVPIAFASAGVRRILALAYFLVWAWHEHAEAAELLAKAAERRLVILFDEPETHLHPRWQRSLMPSLLAAIEQLSGQEGQAAQLLIATHAPLVLASLEPIFNQDTDELFHLAIEDGSIILQSGIWCKQGDVSNWLVSETFGLAQARSLDAEKAIDAAQAFMRGEKKLPQGLNSKPLIHQALQRLLPAHDEFWPLWLVESGTLPTS